MSLPEGFWDGRAAVSPNAFAGSPMTLRRVRTTAGLQSHRSMKPTDPKPASYADVNPIEGEVIRWEGHFADDVGATYGPDPMALLVATRDSLYLTSARGSFRLPRPSIHKVSRGSFYPWMFLAVRFHHAIDGMPRELQFKPLRTTPRAVREQLRALGYPVP